MRLTVAWLCCLMLCSFASAQTGFDQARALASRDHKCILLHFSGSDWCGPCIRLQHDFFEAKAFSAYASDHLVLIDADFPRQKKNRLPAILQQENEKLADAYNPQGSFPLTLLLDAEGKILKQWDGIPKLSPAEFVLDIKTTVDAHK